MDLQNNLSSKESSEYPSATMHEYKFNEMILGRLSMFDAISVDGDKEVVRCYVFKYLLW
jgi:hypothetical protein